MQTSTASNSSKNASQRSEVAFQRCMNLDCGATYDVGQVLTRCRSCGDLLDVAYDWDRVKLPKRLSDFQEMWTRRHEPLRFSGVWRFHELLPYAPQDKVVTVGEGQTLLQQANAVARFVNVKSGNLYLQYEGMNPSGRSRTTECARPSLMPLWSGPNEPLVHLLEIPVLHWQCTVPLPAYEGRHLHRERQDFVWKTFASVGVRCVDRANCWRFR